MKVVIVESPTKTKTIKKYLGADYKILASMGHVRDLPSKDGSVDPDSNFSMTWEIDARSQKNINEISSALKGADELLLATDPDREGEAISWHVYDILKNKGLLNNIGVKRVVFYEITKRAITEAVNHPRDLDQDLINAYLARRALDYLVGFRLSPVLWRKLPGSRSAGRVQSVALRLITDREDEIEAFQEQEYWTVTANAKGDAKKTFEARLTHLENKKLEKFSLNNEELANGAVETVNTGSFQVAKIEKKQLKRNPSPPFTTSTLQQEASRKLGFGASRTMRIAQQLYEGVNIGSETVGLITYMRTDSVSVAQEALEMSRSYIKDTYGDNYLPETARFYKSKAKNAQEAHEAIRPTDIAKSPKEVNAYLEPEQARLYELIWKRMVASQMQNAVLDQVAVDIADDSKQTVLRANGSTIAFDGFIKVYREGRDEEEEGEDDEKMLPALQEGEKITLSDVTPNQHFTQPPPRYTEASLVKKMEELGIGRPSTYASIINTLQDRDYVELQNKQFHPMDRGRIVTAFLLNFFQKYVEYDFTANLEEQLDEISAGNLDWIQVLNQFWEQFHKAIDEAGKLRISEVLDKLNIDLAPMLFPDSGDGKDPRICPKCQTGEQSLKVGKFGAFIGCSNYPECGYTRKLGQTEEIDESQAVNFEAKVMGQDSTGTEITLRYGPYGYYFQWGEAEGKAKPKRASLPAGVNPDDATLEMALDLGSLPRKLGPHPETGAEISASIGRFGPYVKHQDRFISLKGDDTVLNITLERAIEIINTAPPKKATSSRAKKKPKGKKKT